MCSPRSLHPTPILFYGPCSATAATFDFESYMKERAQLVNKALDDSLPQRYPEVLLESMRCVRARACTAWLWHRARTSCSTAVWLQLHHWSCCQRIAMQRGWDLAMARHLKQLKQREGGSMPGELC